MKRLLLILFALSVLPCLSFAQDQIISLDVIEIKGEAIQPTAIIPVSRKRPEYKPTSIDKSFSEDLVPLREELLAPNQSELEPKKIEKLKDLLAKDRV